VTASISRGGRRQSLIIPTMRCPPTSAETVWPCHICEKIGNGFAGEPLAILQHDRKRALT